MNTSNERKNKKENQKKQNWNGENFKKNCVERQ